MAPNTPSSLLPTTLKFPKASRGRHVSMGTKQKEEKKATPRLRVNGPPPFCTYLVEVDGGWGSCEILREREREMARRWTVN